MTPLMSAQPGYGRNTRTRRLPQAVRVVILVVAFAGLVMPATSFAKGGSASGGSPSSTSTSGGASPSSSSKSGGGSSTSSSKGGGLKGALCGAANNIGVPGLSTLAGAVLGGTGVCNSSSGSTDPVAATSSVLKKLFFGAAAVGIGGDLVLQKTLTKVPNYSTNSPGVVHLETATTAIAFALLGLILTLSIIRYMLAGLAGAGGTAIDGVIRTFAAALLIVAWPFLFSSLISIVNAITSALLTTHAATGGFNAIHALVAGGAASGLASAFFGSTASFGWLIGILIFGLNAILVVGLLLLKVALGATTSVIFCAMPLALALWPLRETSWLSEKLASVLSLAVAAPLIWALIFGVASALAGAIAEAGILAIPIRLLTALSTYVLAIFAPFLLLRQAHGGIRHPVGDFASQTASRAAGRLVGNAVAMQIPASMGGRKESGQPQSQLQLSKDLAGGGRQTETYKGGAADAVAASLGATAREAKEAVANAPEDGIAANGNGSSGGGAERRAAAAAAAAAAGYPAASADTQPMVAGPAAGAGEVVSSAAQAGNDATAAASVAPGTPLGQTTGAAGSGAEAGAGTSAAIDGAGAGAGGGGGATPEAVEAGAAALGAGAGALTESALVGQGSGGDGSSWDLVSPGELGIHESAHAGAMLDGAQKASPSLAQGTAAMDAFSPSMQSTFAGIHDIQGPGELRKVAAATALTSQQISDGERGGLTVLAGQSDQNFADIFRPGTPLSNDRSAPVGTSTQEPVAASGERSDPSPAPREQP